MKTRFFFIRTISSTMALAAGISLAGCAKIPGTEAYVIEQAQQSVAAGLKDPASAQFTNVRLSEDGAVCGYVNGKNVYGGYVGREGFLYQSSGQTTLYERSRTSHNPGIEATNKCEYRYLHAACMKGESVTYAATMNGGPTGPCANVAEAAIKRWHKGEVDRLHALGVQPGEP